MIKTACLAFLLGNVSVGHCTNVSLDISGMKDVDYGYFMSGTEDTSGKVLDDFFWQVPVVIDGSNTCYISFPVKQWHEFDCLQPSNENAALFSCANVNSDNVTDAYMKLFGIMPYNEKGDTLKLIKTYALDQNGKINVVSRPVIQFCDNEFQANNFGGYGAFLSQEYFSSFQLAILDSDTKGEFIKNFRKIASSPVGRVLLYRILVESLRQRNSVLSGGVSFCDAKLIDRSNGRGVIIARCSYDNRDYFLPSQYTYAAIGVSQKEMDGIQPVKLSTVEVEDFNVVVDDKNSAADVTLFHEMLHWFHHLQNKNRALNVRGENTYPSYDYKVYYGDVPMDLLAWGGIHTEELMTIAGKPDYRIDKIKQILPHYVVNEGGTVNDIQVNNGFIAKTDEYIEGDDLSENAYRLMKKISGDKDVRMRWGHGSVKFYQDSWNYRNQPQYFDMIKRIKLADTAAKVCVSSIINAGRAPNEKINVIGFLDD